MKKMLKSFCLSLLFIGTFWLLQGQQTVFAAVTAPDFATLPINQVMISTAGKAGSLQGVEGHNYVQINDTTINSSGAVWFNNPISFTRDFHLEMAFYIENTANDSDGLAFVLQSSGPQALASEAGSTIGVWSNISGSDPLSQGAIANSIAIEFDTYYNNNGGILATDRMMDRDVTTKGHHIAWSYPGSDASYTTDGWLMVDKVLNHYNTVGVTDISDGNWHTFIVDYNESTQQFHYAVPDFNVDVSIPVDDTFKNNLNLTNSAPVYFGFTGANGGFAQNKAVAFVDVQGLVEIDMRTGVFQREPDQFMLDTETVMDKPIEVDASKEITYATYIDFKQTSDLSSLNPGIKLKLTLPDNVSVKDTVYFGKPEDTMINGFPDGGSPIEYIRETGQISVVLPKLEKGNAYIVHFRVKYSGTPIDANIDEVIPVETTFSGNAFISSFTSGGAATHFYTVKGKFPPTLTSGQATMSEAQKTAPILRQNRNAYTDISVEDSNSTQAQLFISDLFSQEKELQEEDFTLKTVLERTDLSDPFHYTLESETSDLSPGTTYYFATYVVDTEGNSPAIHYFAIDFRGIVELKSVPESFKGTTVTINELARAMDSNGLISIKVPIATTSKPLAISNTSEGTWKLSGQTTPFMNSGASLADEVQLVLYDSTDNSLFCTITSDKKVLFEQTPSDKALSLDLSQYDWYLRFVPKIETLSPGTYQGKVNWQLDSTITD